MDARTSARREAELAEARAAAHRLRAQHEQQRAANFRIADRTETEVASRLQAMEPTWQLLADRRIDEERVGADEHCVAICRRLADRGGRDDRARARTILDHHRLAMPACRQEISKDARDDIGRTAGGKRHHQRGFAGRVQRPVGLGSSSRIASTERRPRKGS